MANGTDESIATRNSQLAIRNSQFAIRGVIGVGN
eukprot:CAMPEP_0172355660 /NCGR_PEP_ID=MMETSP1060-20121228/62_1 /TAXON_ID=37318 /ORGANISM="Pseudo-nitzschia pungens, Strain cf. cingulata" /LENGTH=33 /DNA_ID= /DNA_START= /DNA_END= /DNA_ORIENTATION=